MPTAAFRHAFHQLARRIDGEPDADWHADLLGPDDERSAVERYVARVYAEHHGARLAEFMPWLLAFRDREGELLAAVGIRPARASRLFVEQYLDQPADQVVARALGRPIDRDSLVEVGSLAAARPGDARRLILCLTRGLHAAGQRWVLFTATRQLRNAFARLGLAPVALGPADPARLAPAATDWGRYYDSAPEVVCGDIAAGAAQIDAQRTRVRARLQPTPRLLTWQETVDA
jgi:hypothetical protein